MQIKGHAKVAPAMNSLEYIFSSLEGLGFHFFCEVTLLISTQDSETFQKLVFGKDLEPKMPINVRRIFSGRTGKPTKECDLVALRVWRIPNSDSATRNNFSILFPLKEEGKPVKAHIEIFCGSFPETLTSKSD